MPEFKFHNRTNLLTKTNWFLLTGHHQKNQPSLKTKTNLAHKREMVLQSSAHFRRRFLDNRMLLKCLVTSKKNPERIRETCIRNKREPPPCQNTLREIREDYLPICEWQILSQRNDNWCWFNREGKLWTPLRFHDSEMYLRRTQTSTKNPKSFLTKPDGGCSKYRTSAWTGSDWCTLIQQSIIISNLSSTINRPQHWLITIACTKQIYATGI